MFLVGALDIFCFCLHEFWLQKIQSYLCSFFSNKSNYHFEKYFCRASCVDCQNTRHWSNHSCGLALCFSQNLLRKRKKVQQVSFRERVIPSNEYVKHDSGSDCNSRQLANLQMYMEREETIVESTLERFYINVERSLNKPLISGKNYKMRDGNTWFGPDFRIALTKPKVFTCIQTWSDTGREWLSVYYN